MGIDARMFIRYKNAERPTDEQLARWSWDLCNSVGASNFFIDDGLPSKEYHAKHEAWHRAFKAHPLYEKFVDLSHGEERTKVHEQIFADVGKPPKQLRRALSLTNEKYPLEVSEIEHYNLNPDLDYTGKIYTQDGDPVFAEDGEWFIEVSLWSRYYGVDYERGNLQVICTVAEWLEYNIGGEVWYGGDSSGVLAEPFGEKQRQELKRHMYSVDGRAYFESFQQRGTFPTPKPCGLCIPGEPRFNRNGWGNGDKYVAVSCGGCGKHFTSNDGGVTWETDKKED